MIVVWHHFNVCRERTPFLANDLKWEGKNLHCSQGRQEVTFLHESCYIWKTLSYNRDSSTFTCDLLFIGFFLFDSVNLCIQTIYKPNIYWQRIMKKFLLRHLLYYMEFYRLLKTKSNMLFFIDNVCISILF